MRRPHSGEIEELRHRIKNLEKRVSALEDRLTRDVDDSDAETDGELIPNE